MDTERKYSKVSDVNDGGMRTT